MISEESRLPNPRNHASIFSRMVFRWLMPLMLKGYKQPLEKSDLYEVPDEDESKLLGKKLSQNWEMELEEADSKKKNPNYAKTLAKTFWIEFFTAGVYIFIEDCIIRIAQPLFLGGLIKYYVQDRKDTYLGWIYSFGLAGISYMYLFSHHPYFFKCQHMGMRLRISSCNLIYSKAMKLSKAALGQTTIGQMVNLLSNDVNRFDQAVIFTHFLWIGPTQALIVTAILWRELGPSCLAGMVLLLLYVPLQSGMGKLFSHLRRKTASKTDERIRLMNEAINAMRIIKMYAWEKPIANLLEIARINEMRVILKTNYCRSLNMSLFFVSSKLIVFFALLTYVLTGNILTAEKVFLVTSLIDSVRLSMTLFFPYAIATGSEALVSCKRIQEFLMMEEIEDTKYIDSSNERPKPEDCSIESKDISARWTSSPVDAVSNLSFSVKTGQLLAVIGAIGSGKSSLLQSILGELPLTSGHIKVKGKVAYASQEAWIFSGTIKDNILFGQPFIKKKYMEIIEACCLEKDIDGFPQGDGTVVGERGVSLSGGQKARINLARAVYFDADIYLLDDPLSAVDTHVGRSLFEDCIKGYLRNKVTVLVTHQTQFLNDASSILVLKNGWCEALGSYEELKSKGISLEHTQNDQKYSIRKIENNIFTNKMLDRIKMMTRQDSETRSYTDISLGSIQSLPEITLQNNEGFQTPMEERSVDKEKKHSGSISAKVYWNYIAAGGSLLFNAFIFLLFVTTQVIYTGVEAWLSYWTNEEQRVLSSGDQDIVSIFDVNGTSLVSSEFGNLTVARSINRNYFVTVYAGMAASLLVLAFVRAVSFFTLCVTASKTLHNRMLGSLLATPIQFFDTHPIGIILNRFTKDMGQVDELLPPTFYDCYEIFFIVLGVIIIVASINVWILIPTFILLCLLLLSRRFYITTAREVKRLEGITRSPVFSHLSTTLHGLTTIRAFKVQNKFIDIFDQYQDYHSSAWFIFICLTRWLGIVVDSIAISYLSIVTFSFLFTNESMGGNIGLAISSALMVMGAFQWGVRQSAEVENHMTSVERILEYSRLTPEEDPKEKKDEPEEDWPSSGKITFSDVSLIYSEEDPPVLRNLNFNIKPGKKIGIVGRTGAGKSSLITCLFKLRIPSGNIEIDGVKTDKISLENLRKNISIIPQDPTLFSGNLRYNLDPFSIYKDSDIWQALEEVQLNKLVKEMDQGLNMTIHEGGGNLSVGQRQLVCLARAILRQSKILAMDEATANVDQLTDNLIQSSIRKKFSDCTVLTIAHRLNTIMDSDKVMVMSAGRLKEYDEPFVLLQDEKSLFSSLVRETGRVTEHHLRNIALEAFQKRHEKIIAEFKEDQFDDISLKSDVSTKL